MSAVPEVEVHIADSNHTIGGIGEPGVPTVAPAVANAIFTTTGIMLRELPFNLDMLRQAGS
jgi:isoquinoline 1-oxidoreductase beta subunit